MKTLIPGIFFYLAAFTNLQAQNMVPNPSFENLRVSPSCWTFGSKAQFDFQIYDWFLPNEGTTDLLSTQLSPSCVTALPTSTYPPVDWFPRGYQMPRTGTTVAGIKPLNEARREYLEVKLACPMVAGKEYYAEMYVSLAEKTNYAQNSLGMYFSDTLVYINSTSMLNFSPQIVENTILNDTMNWVKISGTFMATGPHQYLIIGSFATAAQVQTQYLGPKSEVNFPYYYIDDVWVQPLEAPTVSLSGDSVVCLGDMVQLQASGWQNERWYRDNALISTGPQLNYAPSQSQTLELRSNICNWPLSRSVEVTVHPLPMPALGPDTLMCAGSAFTLDPGSGFATYLWQDNSISSTFTVHAPGLYEVEVSDLNLCVGRDELQVGLYAAPVADLGPDQLTCEPQGRFELYSAQINDQYLWQDGSTSPALDYSKEGLYWVAVSNACGQTASDTVQIEKIDMQNPNLLTPNGDGLNEVFEISGVETGKGSLSVYNRYGDRVFEDKTYAGDWNPKELSDGLYYYLYTYPTCPDRKGWLQILK